MDAETFERERLALFADHGFPGESAWVADTQDRQTYAIVDAFNRNDPACPTILIHGGLSEASEWFALARHVAGAS